MSSSAPPPASQNPADRRTFVRTTLDLGDVLPHPWGREAEPTAYGDPATGRPGPPPGR
ncbi:hypothetical protein ACWC0A_24695 [Streptomyces scopuliridis]